MVRLVTVIGHGVNLLPHFIKHYKRYVDEINIAIYKTDLYPTLEEDINKIIKDHDNVKIVKVIEDRVFDWEKVTSLYNFIKDQKPFDWWVIADIDEFHLYPDDDIVSLINDCEEYGWDIVRGGFIDRIGEDGEFVELKDDVSIWEQFPNAGFFRYHMSKACPNKICLIRGGIQITSGQHYANIDGHTTWKWQGWGHPSIAPIPSHTVQVHHFKWDKTSIDRVKAVAELKEDYSYSDEYFKMFTELLKTKYKINLNKREYMFELGLIYPEYNRYKSWNKLINKITSI
jgi:superoxide dismutase